MYSDSNQRDFARKLRTEMTEAEQDLWRELRRRQLKGCKFRRQAAIGRYIVDFVCFDANLIVELDGGQHNQPAKREYDERRTDWLASQGFRVLRYWNYEVEDDLDSVTEAIWLELQTLTAGQPPSPNPSPPRGGG